MSFSVSRFAMLSGYAVGAFWHRGTSVHLSGVSHALVRLRALFPALLWPPPSCPVSCCYLTETRYLCHRAAHGDDLFIVADLRERSE